MSRLVSHFNIQYKKRTEGNRQDERCLRRERSRGKHHATSRRQTFSSMDGKWLKRDPRKLRIGPRDFPDPEEVFLFLCRGDISFPPRRGTIRGSTRKVKRGWIGANLEASSVKMAPARGERHRHFYKSIPRTTCTGFLEPRLEDRQREREREREGLTVENQRIWKLRAS